MSSSRGRGLLRRVVRPLNEALEAGLGVRVVDARQPGVRIGPEWVERLLYFERLLSQVEHVRGDVVECGVAGGESLAMFASLVRERGQQRKVWGFDSFRGLPPAGSADLGTSHAHAREGMFGWANPGVVRRELRGHAFSDGEITRAVAIVPGDFERTLPRYSGGPIALLHVDADLYESYRVALRSLWPHVAVGGIVAFDEYEDRLGWPGASRAVDEFFADVSHLAEFHRDERARKTFVVKLG